MTRSRWGGWTWTALALLLVGWLLVPTMGCATPRIDWNARVGTFSQDDAIRELGPPDKSARLTDGSVVSDWLTARGMRTASSYAGGWGYPYGAYGGVGPSFIVVDPPSPDRYLRLTFDPQGKLVSWSKVYK